MHPHFPTPTPDDILQLDGRRLMDPGDLEICELILEIANTIILMGGAAAAAVFASWRCRTADRQLRQARFQTASKQLADERGLTLSDLSRSTSLTNAHRLNLHCVFKVINRSRGSCRTGFANDETMPGQTLIGSIRVDETYMDRIRGNMPRSQREHKTKRRALRQSTPVVETSQVVKTEPTKVPPSTPAETLRRFTQRHTGERHGLHR